MVTTRLPAAIASSCILRLLAKLARPTCAMFAPGSPSSISARTGLPLLRPSSRSRMSKCASSVISPTLLERQPEPEHARPRHRIVAADQQRQLHAASALAATASRMRAVASSMRQPGELDIAAVGDLASTARGRSRRRSGRSAAASAAAAPARGRSAPASPIRRPAARRPARPARRVLAPTISSERLGQPAMALTVASRARLRRQMHVGPAARRLQHRDASRRRRAIRSALIENGAIGIADGKIVRVGKRTELAGFRAKEVDRARRRLGHAGPDRLPHPPRLRRHPRRRACDAPRRREL